MMIEPIKLVGNTAHVSLDRYQGLLNSEKELLEIKKEKPGSCMNKEESLSTLGMNKEEELICSRNIEKGTEEILAEREETHGDFKVLAIIVDAIKYQMEQSPGWPYLRATQKESLGMIAHKIGRILAGDPDIKDHWDDIAGYATLISRELK